MLSIENSLVLIIDIQEKLVNAVGKYSPLEKVCKLTRAADILNIPVLLTEQYPQGLGATVPELKNCLPDNTECVEKTSFSALDTQEVVNILEKSGRKQIVICGIETHICVYQTACDLIERGFDVYVLKDGCASRNKYEFKSGIELMKQMNAKVTCTEIVLFEWLKTSKHPNFKEVQLLIKKER